MFLKVIGQLEEFFGISKKQAKGAFSVIILCLFLVLFPSIYKRYLLPLFPLPVEKINEKALDSLAAKLNRQAPQQSFNENRATTKSTDTKPVIHLKPFDPNLSSISELEALGIPTFLAKRIDKYRSKGGKFRKKEDLLHIYDFPSDTYHQLESYIMIPENKPSSSHDAEKKTTTNEHQFSNIVPKTNENKTPSKPTLSAFDINTTDTTELIKLKGIGSKLSARIIKFRDGLGGFHSTAQYEDIYGLDSTALAELYKYAKIESPIRKIKINEASAEQLLNQSYLKNKKSVSVIINYRTQHGNYQSIDDLRKIRILDEETLRKLEPYLEF